MKKDLEEILEKLIRINLCGREGERLLVLTDDLPFRRPLEEIPSREKLGEKIIEVGKRIGLQVKLFVYPSVGGHGKEPPPQVWKEVFAWDFLSHLEDNNLWDPLLKKEISEEQFLQISQWAEKTSPLVSVVLALSAYSLTHTLFRRFCTATGKVQVATMPGVEPFMFWSSLDADYGKISRRSEKVADLLTKAEKGRIVSGNGRHVLTFSLLSRKGIADRGIIEPPDGYGNLPGGEGFIAPVEGSAEGSIDLTLPKKKQTVFTFQEGRVVDMEGDEGIIELFQSAFSRYPSSRYLCEFGVGTNEKASDPFEILEAEKILGTVHIAMGDNQGFGGNLRVPFHRDLVCFSPTVFLTINGNDVVLIQEGDLKIPE